MKSRSEIQQRITDFELACVASGLDVLKTAALLAPLKSAADTYYNDDLSQPVNKCVTALAHGLLRSGFRYDRPVSYLPCGGAPIGWDDVRVLFAHEDQFTQIDEQEFVDSVVLVTPTAPAGDPEAAAPEPYYQSDLVDTWVATFPAKAPVVKSGLALIAEHGNAVAIVPGAEQMFGGAVMVSAPSTDDIKKAIYDDRHFSDLIRTRGLSVKTY